MPFTKQIHLTIFPTSFNLHQLSFRFCQLTPPGLTAFRGVEFLPQADFPVATLGRCVTTFCASAACLRRCCSAASLRELSLGFFRSSTGSYGQGDPGWKRLEVPVDMYISYNVYIYIYVLCMYISIYTLYIYINTYTYYIYLYFFTNG